MAKSLLLICLCIAIVLKAEPIELPSEANGFMNAGQLIIEGKDFQNIQPLEVQSSSPSETSSLQNIITPPLANNYFSAVLYISTIGGDILAVNLRDYSSVTLLSLGTDPYPTTVNIYTQHQQLMIGTYEEKGFTGIFYEYNLTYPNGAYPPVLVKPEEFSQSTIAINDVVSTYLYDLNSVFIAAESGIYYLEYKKILPVVNFTADQINIGIPQAIYYDGTYIYWAGYIQADDNSRIMKAPVSLLPIQAISGGYAWVFGAAINVGKASGQATGIDGNGVNQVWITTQVGVYEYNTEKNSFDQIISNLQDPSGVRYHDGNLFISNNVNRTMYQYNLKSQSTVQLNFSIPLTGRFYIDGSTVTSVCIALVSLLISITMF